MEVQPSFYANIPAFVRYDKDLKPNAKLLYGEITALTNSKGYCWAKNEYFAELYDVDPATVSRWISQLINKGYLVSKLYYKGKTKVVEKRHLYLSNAHFMDDEKVIQMDDKKIIQMDDEKVKDNNTLFNNTNNIKDISKSSNAKASKPKRIFSDDSYEMLMVNLFISEMQKNSTLFKEPSNKQQWCNHVRLIIDIDLKEKDADRNKRFTILKELVLHSCNKPYFYKNIRSIDKLRKRLGEVSDDLQETRTKQNKKPYNNYNTSQPQQTMQYNEPDTDTLYSGGDWE